MLAALIWLKKHQNQDGSWGADSFEQHCSSEKCQGKGKSWMTPASTGMSILANLAAGSNHQVGRFKQQVRSALRYLRDQQQPDGGFYATENSDLLFNHLIATLAMVEAYGRTKSPLVAIPSRKGLRFLLHFPLEKWSPEEEKDIALFGWFCCVLYAAEKTNLLLKEEKEIFFEKKLPQIFLLFSQSEKQSPLFQAVQMVYTMFHLKRKGAKPEKILKIFPSFEKFRKNFFEEKKHSRFDNRWIQEIYFFGSLVQYALPVKYWEPWHDDIIKTLISSQRVAKSGCQNGSWDVVNESVIFRGRPFHSAFCSLSLSIFGRDLKIFKPAPPEE